MGVIWKKNLLFSTLIFGSVFRDYVIFYGDCLCCWQNLSRCSCICTRLFSTVFNNVQLQKLIVSSSTQSMPSILYLHSQSLHGSSGFHRVHEPSMKFSFSHQRSQCFEHMAGFRKHFECGLWHASMLFGNVTKRATSMTMRQCAYISSILNRQHSSKQIITDWFYYRATLC